MNIKWYDKNSDTNLSNMTDSCQMLNKLYSFDANHKGQTINLVFANKTYLDSFARFMKGMSNNFDQLNLRIGLIDMTSKLETISSEIIESSVIFFGDNKDEKKYLSIFKNDAAMISSHCLAEHKTIAYQRHLSSEINPLSVSLGEFREDFSSAESALRVAKAIFFKTDAVRKQDSHSEKSRITGLDIYEICQLLRYCGLSSDHNFLFINVEEENSKVEIWDMISTSIWYYLEGRANRRIDSDQDDTKVYIVENEYFADGIVFIKSLLTQRWWYLHPDSKIKIPCTEKDYKSVRQGEIPDNIAIQLV